MIKGYRKVIELREAQLEVCQYIFGHIEKQRKHILVLDRRHGKTHMLKQLAFLLSDEFQIYYTSPNIHDIHKLINYIGVREWDKDVVLDEHCVLLVDNADHFDPVYIQNIIDSGVFVILTATDANYEQKGYNKIIFKKQNE